MNGKRMSKEECLKIFSLNGVYTEENLKKAYREEAKKRHPDLYATAREEEKKEAEEQMKKINEAYETLIANVFTFNDILKKDFENEVLKGAKVPGVEYPFYYDICYNKLLMLYNSIDEKEIRTEEEYKRTERILLKKVLEIYKKLVTLFLSNHNLTSVKTKINYGCTLSQIYSQLEEIAKKNSKKTVLEKNINKIINTYLDNELYPYLESVIKRVKEDYLKSFTESDSIKVKINEFKAELIRIFRLYQSYQSRINKVEKKLDLAKFYKDKYLNGNLKAEKDYLGTYELYLNVIKHFKNGTIHESSIIALENKVEDYTRTIPIHIARVIRSSINVKYNQSALNQEAHGFSDKVYCYASNLLNTMEPNETSISAMYALTELTFTDAIKDIMLLSNVQRNSSELNNSNIFIKNGRLELYSGIFNELVEKDGKLYMRSYGALNTLEDNPVTFEEIFTNYISFEGMLSVALFDGNMYYNGTGETVVLYRWDKRLLIVNKRGELEVIDAVSLKFPYPNEESVKYQDKEYLKTEISKIMHKERERFPLFKKKS